MVKSFHASFALNGRRARCSCDLDVPTAIPVISEMSLCLYPCTSCKTKTVRAAVGSSPIALSRSILPSGRGVGMDVVRRNIETLHGSVSIDSTAGEGTTVTIRLPLTLAIIEGFSVGVGDQVYILPLAAVSECVDLPADIGVRRTGVIELRGSPLPYIGLRELLGTSGQPAGRQSIVVVRDGAKRGGLAVDTIYGESQTVIKPLGRLLRGMRGTAGSTVLGDGRVALILDVPDLLRQAAELQTRETPSTPPRDRSESNPLHSIAGSVP